MKLWKKVLAAVTAGMLCLGCAGVSGLQGVLGSVSAVLPVCAAENWFQSECGAATGRP